MIMLSSTVILPLISPPVLSYLLLERSKTCVSSRLTEASRTPTLVSNRLTEASRTPTLVSNRLTEASRTPTLVSNRLTEVSKPDRALLILNDPMNTSPNKVVMLSSAVILPEQSMFPLTSSSSFLITVPMTVRFPPMNTSKLNEASPPTSKFPLISKSPV